MFKKGIDLLTSQMKGEWPRVPVSDIATAVIGGTPRRSVAEYWDGNLPWATAKDVARVPSRYLDEVQENITEAGLESSTTKLMPAGTVVITARGTVGALAQLRREMAFNQTCYAILPGDSINNNFLFYALKGTITEMRALTYGTVFDTITRRTFDDWLLPLPPLTEQRAIAHILGTLDDKIELNRRMNETLEEMARAIFKSWFVDFDPVRAKMDGRWRRGESLPGMPAEMYDLFPSRLVDSELGEIPEGWGVGPIGSIFNQQKRRIGEAHAVVLSAVTKGELVRSDEYFTKKVYSKSINKYLAVEQWDIAYNPSRINIGSVGMLKEPVLGAVSPVYIVVRPESEYRWYMEFFLRLSQAKKWIETLATGSVRQALSYQDFASIPCVIPPPRVVRGFDEHQDQFYLTFKAHSKESQILVDLRDTLLPKLLSGELRVRDAEKFMESVV